MAAELLPEELWNEIEPLFPRPRRPSRKGGRPPVDNKAALRGIIFVLRSGIPWQMLPTEAFEVSGSSCWRRLSEWTAAGIWPELHRRLLNRLGKLGGVNMENAVVDSQSVRAVKGGRTPVPTPPIAANPAANAIF
jgi:transposase